MLEILLELDGRRSLSDVLAAAETDGLWTSGTRGRKAEPRAEAAAVAVSLMRVCSAFMALLLVLEDIVVDVVVQRRML